MAKAKDQMESMKLSHKASMEQFEAKVKEENNALLYQLKIQHDNEMKEVSWSIIDIINFHKTNCE